MVQSFQPSFRPFVGMLVILRPLILVMANSLAAAWEVSHQGEGIESRGNERNCWGSRRSYLSAWPFRLKVSD